MRFTYAAIVPARNFRYLVINGKEHLCGVQSRRCSSETESLRPSGSPETLVHDRSRRRTVRVGALGMFEPSATGHLPTLGGSQRERNRSLRSPGESSPVLDRRPVCRGDRCVTVAPESGNHQRQSETRRRTRATRVDGSIHSRRSLDIDQVVHESCVLAPVSIMADLVHDDLRPEAIEHVRE